MTTYAGFEVLTEEPSRQPRDDAFNREQNWMDTQTGDIGIDAKEKAPKPVRPFLWIAYSRAEVAALLAFMDARVGRLVPFWCPTWDADLLPTADIGASDSSITIESMGYTPHMFPQRARRHLAITARDGTWRYRKVLSAVDNGNGTETIGLDAPLGVSIPKSAALVCFMPLYRMNGDDYELFWHTAATAECKLQMVEIPNEVPA